MKSLAQGIAILFLTAAVLFSQPAASPPLDAQIARVAAYVNSGDYDKAALLAERLYAGHPDSPNLYALLKSAYLGLKEYGKLEELVAGRLERHPKDKELYLDRLELSLRQGIPAKAEADARTYLGLAAKDTLSYADVANRYLAAGYAEEAVKIYEGARRTLQNPAVFSSNLAETYRSLRRWREALEEYLNWLEADPANPAILPRVRSLLADLPADEETIGPFLERLLAKKPTALNYRLEGEWELRSGKYEAALSAYQEADRRGTHNGELLLELARQLSLYDPSRLAALAAFYEKTYPKSPDWPQVNFLLARAQVEEGEFLAARTTYQKIAASGPLPQDRAEADFELAGLALDYQAQPDSALVFLNGIGQTSLVFLRVPAAVLKARALAALGRTDEARAELAAVQSKTAPWGEEPAFLLAEWDFFDAKFSEAANAYTDLINDFPRGERVNDALRRLALLKIASGAAPLSVYAAFLKDLAQFKDSKASDRLSNLEAASPDLAAEAYYDWGTYWADRKRWREAESAFQKIRTDHPRTQSAPLALEKLGDLARLGQRPAEARACYEAVLENYPDAVNLETVRGKLRRLPGQIPEKNPKAGDGKT